MIHYIDSSTSLHRRRYASAEFFPAPFNPMKLSTLFRVTVATLVATVAVLSSSSAAPRMAGMDGITITSQSARTSNVTVRPRWNRWDTIVHDGGRYLVPTATDVSLRQSPDGRRIQWVRYVNIPVTGDVQSASIQSVNVKTTQLDLPLRSDPPRLGAVDRTLSERVQVLESGYSGRTPIVTVAIVVAESDGHSTTLVEHAAFNVDHNVHRVAKKFGFDNVQADDQRLPYVARFFIEREGIYRISADELRNLGGPTDAAGAGSIRIFGIGGRELTERVPTKEDNVLNEIPVIVRTQADGSLRDVIFYASSTGGFDKDGQKVIHSINHYGNRSGYLLSWGNTAGQRAVMRRAAEAEATVRPTHVTGRIYQEEDITNLFTLGSGRRWLGRPIDNNGALTVTTMLPNFRRVDTVRYRFCVAHRSSQRGVVTISDNGQTLAQRDLRGLTQDMYLDSYNDSVSGVLPASSLPMDGRSALRFSYQSNDRLGTGVLDWLEIAYPKATQAIDGEAEFWIDARTEGTYQVDIAGFSGDVFIFDVTDRAAPVLVENISSTGNIAAFRETFSAGEQRRYFIASSLRSAQYEAITFPNLRSSPANTDVIVITHPSLLTSANEYAAYRRSQGELSVSVVTTSDLFTEFSYGQNDPLAIRDYLAWAMTTWTKAPKYVLLWGDGHFDYRNISTGQISFVPTYQSFDAIGDTDGIKSYTSDDLFARTVGDDTAPDLAIGRITITSDVQGRNFLEKLRLYEHSASTDDWRTRLTTIADDGPKGTQGQSDGDLHLAQSENLTINHVSNEIQTRKIYLVEYPTENVARGRRKPAATQDLVSSVNTTGALFLNWVGHGNPRVWADEQILVRETTIGQFSNADKPFFLTAATCDFARFDMTEVQSGAEELFLLPRGGAIAVFSSTRVVYSFSNDVLNRAFYSRLFQRDEDGSFPRIGDAFMDVKNVHRFLNDWKYVILGDPSMRLLLPRERVVFDSINGVTIDSTSALTVKALSTVTVSGHIASPLDDASLVPIHGVVQVTLSDAATTVRMRDTDPAQTMNTWIRPGAALSKGSYRVENGRFTATFIVPKDISFAPGNGSLFGYARSDDSLTFAMGVFDKVAVNGIEAVSFNDVEGPSMKIFMDSRRFISGDIVRAEPILIVDLQDATGINTTGIGIGHDLEASFDDGLKVENLTSTFQTSLEDSKAGTASKQIFGLSPGVHSVRVRAWDILNNVSEATTVFRIVDAAAGIVTEGLTFAPNPFTTSTSIRFTHNLAKPFSARLMVHDLQGRLVVERDMRVLDLQSAEAEWDGRDTGGNVLSTAVYVCTVRITTDDGATHDVRGALQLIR